MACVARQGGAPTCMSTYQTLQPCNPRTALNVHTLCTLNANREAEMGALIFYEYLAACVTVPLFLALFLHVTQLYFG